MAESFRRKDQHIFFCSICLDLLKDPVTIHCGHSYCMSCINDCWDQDDQKGVYSCPQCRQTFTTRPVLNRSTVLAEVMAELKISEPQEGPPAQCYAESGDVECDVCTGRKLKAVKFCLTCLVSYCKTHLQPHYESLAFKKHKVVEATPQLQEKICSQHNKLLEVYCSTDQQCICLLCVMDAHKGHDTVSVAAKRADRQKQMDGIQREFQQNIQKREAELQQLRQAVKTLVCSAQVSVDESEKLFTELICTIQRRRSEVKEQIRAQEKTAVKWVEGLLEQLEQEVAELKKRDAELEKFSHTEDHIHYLQSFQSLCVPPRSGTIPSITINNPHSFDHVKKLVSGLKVQLDDIFNQEMIKISEKVTQVKIVLPLKPRTREEFQEYTCQLTLDPNTACRTLCLSEENRKVSWSEGETYADHPERFTHFDQVLCREGLSGKCYWEAELRGWVALAVSYDAIRRKGESNKCRFGYSDQSWSLECSPTNCFFLHDNIRTKIRSPCPSRIGVCLDHMAGTLSYYSISKKVTLLHKVQTTFTQPLYPGFRLGLESFVRIVAPGGQH